MLSVGEEVGLLPHTLESGAGGLLSHALDTVAGEPFADSCFTLEDLVLEDLEETPLPLLVTTTSVVVSQSTSQATLPSQGEGSSSLDALQPAPHELPSSDISVFSLFVLEVELPLTPAFPLFALDVELPPAVFALFAKAELESVVFSLFALVAELVTVVFSLFALDAELATVVFLLVPELTIGLPQPLAHPRRRRPLDSLPDLLEYSSPLPSAASPHLRVRVFVAAASPPSLSRYTP